MPAVDSTTVAAFKSYLLSPKGLFMPPCSDRTFWGDAGVQQQITTTRTVNGTLMLDWAKNKQPSRYMLVNGVPYKVRLERAHNSNCSNPRPSHMPPHHCHQII